MSNSIEKYKAAASPQRKQIRNRLCMLLLAALCTVSALWATENSAAKDTGHSRKDMCGLDDHKEISPSPPRGDENSKVSFGGNLDQNIDKLEEDCGKEVKKAIHNSGFSAQRLTTLVVGGVLLVGGVLSCRCYVYGRKRSQERV